MKSYRKGSKNSKPRKQKILRTIFKFQGNRTSVHSTSFTSASAKKFSTSNDFDVKCENGFNYRILAFSFVCSALMNMLKTKTCDNKIEIRGLGFKINAKCDCDNRLINFSNYINTGFEINRRIVFRYTIGRHGP